MSGLGSINSTGGNYFQNNPKAHRDLMSHLGSSELLKNTDDEIVDGGFDGVLSRAEELLKEDENRILLENQISKNLNGISTSSYFQLKETLKKDNFGDGMCPGGCGFPLESCRC